MMIIIITIFMNIMDMMMENINKAAIALNIGEQVHQIVYLIKHREDYKNASKIMIENNLSIEKLREKTLKLSQIEIAKLADAIFESKD